MRFIQVSEIQLGFHADSGKRWGRDRAVERAESLKRVIEKAAEVSCELLVITGGLFSHQPVTSELEEVNRLFLSIPSVEVVWIAGDSDCLRPNSPVQSFQFAPNVHFVRGDAPVRLDFLRLNTAVYAMPQTENTSSEKTLRPAARLIETVKEDRDVQESIRFLLLRGGTAEDAKLLYENASFYSYAAVGESRRHREIVPEKAYDSGMLEPANISDIGEHGIYIGDISSATGRLIKLEFVPLAASCYLPLSFEVNEEMTGRMLEARVEDALSAHGKNNIYRIRLIGKRDPDADFDLSALERAYRIEEIVDDTEPQYDFSALFAEHPQDMIGYYISTLRKQEDELSETERKAMYYGIDALLKTADRERRK